MENMFDSSIQKYTLIVELIKAADKFVYNESEMIMFYEMDFVLMHV